MMRIQITLVLQCVCNDNLSDYIIMNNRVQLFCKLTFVTRWREVTRLEPRPVELLRRNGARARGRTTEE